MFLEKEIQIKDICLFSFLVSLREIGEQYLNYIFCAGILPLKVYKNLNNPDKFRSEFHRIGGV